MKSVLLKPFVGPEQVGFGLLEFGGAYSYPQLEQIVRLEHRLLASLAVGDVVGDV